MYRYIEIAEDLKEEFRQKKMKQGDKVPSVRAICKDYNCHQSTAVKALHYLRDREILYAIPQSGFYIVGKETRQELGPDIIDFQSTSPDPSFFPYKDYQKCLNLAIEQHRSSLFEYSNIAGYYPLKQAIAKLVTDDFIFTETKNIVITTGSQQGLSLLTEMDFPNKKQCVLIEEPTYHCYIEYLKLNGIDVVTIDRTFSGIDLLALEEIFKTGKIKFFYIMPRVHNPLGTCLSRNEKKKIVELAYKYDVYIIEDDYMADYVSDKNNDPLITYDLKKSHVIYLRSFSKIIFPGLRVGFAILPEIIREKFEEKKYYNDMGTSQLAQSSLEIYLRNKMYERHVSKMRKRYTSRATIMTSVLNTLDISGSFEHTQTCPMVHTCVDIGKNYSLSKLESKGFKIVDRHKFYYSKNSLAKGYLFINVSNVSDEHIEQGIRNLLGHLGHLK